MLIWWAMLLVVVCWERLASLCPLLGLVLDAGIVCSPAVYAFHAKYLMVPFQRLDWYGTCQNRTCSADAKMNYLSELP